MVGTITNYATSMYTVITNFDEGTPEWSELHYRITCMQDFQQNSIDLAKGIEYRPVPKEWYDWKVNQITEDDDEETIKRKEFNQRILANKKPYFMIYNYAKLKTDFTQYKRSNDTICKAKYRIGVDELRDKTDRTEREQLAYESYCLYSPVNISNSVINRIAWHIERHFANKDLFTLEHFDKEKLKHPDIEYDIELFEQVNKLRETYSQTLQKTIKNSKGYTDNESKMMANTLLLESFINKVYEVCGSEMVACNVLVDVCYKDHKSKDLLWACCSEQLIANLVHNGYNTLRYPVRDEEGTIVFKSEKFSLREIELNEMYFRMEDI